MLIRKATMADLPRLMEILSEARQTIAALGIDQWQEGYPNEEAVTEDIALGRSWCLEQEGMVWATFVLVSREPCYDQITDGRWLTEGENYIAIHRVAIAVARRGQGMAGQIMDFANARAAALGKGSLRIDTHRGNIVMRRMLEKQGFTHCGTVCLPSGAPRVAYERYLVNET